MLNNSGARLLTFLKENTIMTKTISNLHINECRVVNLYKFYLLLKLVGYILEFLHSGVVGAVSQ